MDRVKSERRSMPAILARTRAFVVLACGLLTAGCGTVGNLFGGSRLAEGQPGFVRGFLGGVAADEPQAVVAGREALSAGGNAIDAAVAVGFTLAVTLPSRAGLGGGGACLAYMADPKSVNFGVPETVLFVPGAPQTPGANADRPAALPMLARGLFLMHARYGSRPFETYLSATEQMARFGTPVSRALARDLAVVAGPLLADPGSRAVFGPGGSVLTEGQTLRQPELGATLGQIRVSGVGDLYQGTLARRIEDVSPRIGGPLTVADLRTALPRLLEPIIVPYRSDRVAFLQPPADGGLAAAAAFQSLVRDPGDLNGAAARALATAAQWRTGRVSADALLASAAVQQGPLPALPASTSFATLDRNGNAVVCALSMNNLFGTGRILPGLGFLAAPSPAFVPPPLLSAALAWNSNINGFRAAVGGSGQSGAPLAVAVGMSNTLRSGQPMPSEVPDPGRANVIACSRYLPSESATCGWAVDPREHGLATGGG